MGAAARRSSQAVRTDDIGYQVRSLEGRGVDDMDQSQEEMGIVLPDSKFRRSHNQHLAMKVPVQFDHTNKQ